MSVQTGRMVSADEARGDVSRQSWGPAWAEDLQHTVIVQSEQIAAVLRLHSEDEDGYCGTCVTPWEPLMPSQAAAYPCPTARALGVSGE